MLGVNHTNTKRFFAYFLHILYLCIGVFNKLNEMQGHGL